VLITPAEKKAGENGSSRIAAEAVKKD